MFTLALRKKPADVGTHCDRGWAYLSQDAAGPALIDFEAAVNREPKNFEALLGRGNARVRLRQITGAVDDAEAADRVGSLSERQLYNLTCIYALAVAQLELDAGGGRGPLQQQRIAVYEHRAVAGLRRTLDSGRAGKAPGLLAEAGPERSGPDGDPRDDGIPRAGGTLRPPTLARRASEGRARGGMPPPSPARRACVALAGASG